MATLASKLVKVDVGLRDAVLSSAAKQIVDPDLESFITDGHSVMVLDGDIPAGCVSVLDLFSEVPDKPEMSDYAYDYFKDSKLYDAWSTLYDYAKVNGKPRWPNFTDFLFDEMIEVDDNDLETLNEQMWESVRSELSRSYLGSFVVDDPSVKVEEFEIRSADGGTIAIEGVRVSENWVVSRWYDPESTDDNDFSMTYFPSGYVIPYVWDVRGVWELAEKVMATLPNPDLEVREQRLALRTLALSVN